MTKTCNKCGVKELNWNRKYHEETGKWKLQDHKHKEGEWCVRNIEKKLDNFPMLDIHFFFESTQ